MGCCISGTPLVQNKAHLSTDLNIASVKGECLSVEFFWYMIFFFIWVFFVCFLVFVQCLSRLDELH